MKQIDGASIDDNSDSKPVPADSNPKLLWETPEVVLLPVETTQGTTGSPFEDQSGAAHS